LASDGPPESSTDRRDDLPGRLIVISGASASGKSTLVHKLIERPGFRLQVSISATTREPRTGEIPDVSYYFLTREEFESDRDRDNFLEWAEVHGHLYGTPAEAVRAAMARGICIILVIDVQGAMKVREKVPNALLIFVHAPSFEVLEARLRARATDDEPTILRRLANARREIALADRYDYQIVNNDLDRAVDELAAILTRHRCGG
jgi:guanylate kinase